jgi:hypothetical protein
MDVLSSSVKIYEWFHENDSFCLEEDFIKIINISEEPERDKASILCALKNLEKYEIIQSSEVNFKKSKRIVWTLAKPLASMHQTIEIDYSLALIVAEVINGCAKKFNLKESVCDPAQITPINIRDLSILAGSHLEEGGPLDAPF